MEIRLLLSALIIHFLACLKPSDSVKNQIENKRRNIVCYYDTKYYGSRSIEISPNDINATLCTHLVFAFMKINDQLGIEPVVEWNVAAENITRNTVALKKDNTDLKVLLSVGGWYFNSSQLQQITRDQISRSIFVNNTVAFLNRYGFDGLEIYPAIPFHRNADQVKEDKSYLVLLFQELKKALVPFNFSLTAALPANLDSISAAPKVVKNMAKNLDFISIMAYDLNDNSSDVTVQHAPLYSGNNEKGKLLSVADVVQKWVDLGIPLEKLNLGISAYGRSFSIRNQRDSCPLLNTPISGMAKDSPWIHQPGLMTYYETCWDIIYHDSYYKWIDDQKVPFSFSDSTNPPLRWVGFDDVRSVEAKVEYLLDVGLGGAMLFSIDADDFYGICYDGKFPLLRVINHRLNNVQVDLPSSDRIFNVSWEAEIIRKKELAFKQKLYANKNPNVKASQDVKQFCFCKQGIQSVELTGHPSGLERIEIDCDDEELQKIGLIDYIKVDKIRINPPVHKMFVIDGIAQEEAKKGSFFTYFLSLFGIRF